jgi:hypothetical protein
MSLVLQEIVAGLLVGACALFSLWRLATIAARLRMLEALRSVPALGRAAWLTRLRERTLARSSAACGGCSQAGGRAGDGQARRAGGAPADEATPGAASPNRIRGALRR